MELDKDKKEMINKLITAIQSEATFIRENKDLSLDTQVSKMDVLLDTYHFLRDYERNVKILAKYNAEHKFDKER